jgi:hypothetical protein
MGFVAKEQHDVFFSYATLDNDLQDNWVKNFREALKSRVLLELKAMPDFKEIDRDQLDFFIDDKGLPANGGLVDELIDAIKQSNFLFLFVGENYLRSDYCAKELEWFSSRFSSIERQALDRMFMLMLTRSAVRGASEGKLGEIKSKLKYDIAFDEETGIPIRQLLPTADGRLARNPVYDGLVAKFAKTMVQRMLDKLAAPPAPVPSGEVVVAFGAVTRSLKDYRAALAKEIEQTPGIKVDLLELDDLAGTPDELKDRLRPAKVFVQLVDKSPIGVLGGSQPGGFLALQAQLAHPDLQTLWLEPRDKPDVSVKETDPNHLAYLAKVLAAALKLTRAEFVRDLAKRLNGGGNRTDGSVRVAKIMIEHSVGDQDQVSHVRDIVDAAWSNVAKNGMQLRFKAADWDQMKDAPELLQTFHGIVVVDRSKPLKTLFVQMDDIEDELAKRNCELEHSTFVLPPKSSPTVMSWPTIVFKEQGDNPDLVVVTQEKLRKFLSSVMEKALASEAPSALAHVS